MACEHDMQLTHHSQADDQHRRTVDLTGAIERFDHAGGGLGQSAVRIRDVIRQGQGVARQIGFGNQKVFRHPSRDDLRCPPSRALDELPPLAGATRQTRCVVVDENPHPGPESVDLGANLDDLADRLMPEDQRRFLADVPGHHIP
jgi:hypothetical protein